MFFGLWNTTRANKENILYAIVTIFLLERVRTAWNRTGSRGRRSGAPPAVIMAHQSQLVAKAALLYALPLLLPVVKYLYRSIAELSVSVPGLQVMQSTWIFFAVVIATEAFLAIVIYNLLRVYIERMNAAIGFFTKIGRNMWDGSKNVVQAGSDLGSRAARGVRGVSGAMVARTMSFAVASHRLVARRTASVLARTRRRLRLIRRTRAVEGHVA